MAAKGVELASAYISLSISTDDIPEQVEDAFGKAAKPAEKAGRDAGEKFSKGAKTTLGKGVADALAKELGSAGDKGSKELLRSLASGHRQAERDVQVAGRNYARALEHSMRGGGKEAADKWEAEFKRSLQARDESSAFFNEFERQGSARGHKVGTAVGTVVGKGIGAALVLGIGAATTAVGAAVGGIGLALTKGFQRLKKIDDAEFKLRALGNTTADVEKIMANAEASVKGTAFALDEAASAAAAAVAAGVKPGAELAEYLTTISDTAAIAGTSFEEMASIFNKVTTNNKAYTDDLQMLADRGVPVFQYLQRQYGVTADEFQKMVEDGKVSAVDFRNALETNLTGAAKKMGESFSGSMANVEAALGRVGAAVLKPVFGEAAGGVGSLQTALDSLGKWLNNNQDKVIDFWAMVGDAAIVGGQQVVLAVSDISEAVADFIAPIGDVLGAMNKFQAWQADIRGDHETAAALREEAEAFFGWGEDLHSVSDRLQTWVENSDSWRDRLRDWADTTKNAAQVTRALGDALITFPNGEIRLDDVNVDNASAKLDALGIKIVELPDGSTTIEAETEEGQKRIDDFLAKNNPTPPATVPVEPQTAAADAKMQTFVDTWSKIVISPIVDPKAPGYTGSGGYNPLTGPLSSNPGNANTGGALTPETQNIQGYLRNSLGFQGDIGGWRPPDGYNEHSSGKASDVMVGSAAEGNALLPNLLRQPGVEYILWQQKTWYPNGTSKPMEDRGSPTQNHMDHLHVKTFASGGGIYGPGTGTSDSIPAWLSNGEHVLTAKDVAAMGGHAGVYAFRNAIHRDKGGAIDWRLPGESKPGNATKGNFNPNMKIDTSTTTWRGEDGVTGMMRRLLPEDLPGWKLGQTPYGYLAGFKSGDVEFAQWASMVMGKNRGWMSSLKVDQKPGAWPPRAYATGGAAGAAQDMSTSWDEEKWKQLLALNPGASPAQIAQQAMGTPHAGSGAAPGPRTEGYIPAAAGNTAPVGQGGLSNFLDLGESAIHNLIDTGAQLGSMAVSAAAAAGSFGAGAAAGPAASTAIQMGAEAAKRGVTYGYDMAGIWGEALVEQIFPFGAPRWLGSANPMAFMPQWGPQEGQKEPGTMGKAAESIQSWAQPANPAMDIGTGAQGAQAALGAAKQQPSYQAAPPQGQTQAPPPVNPMDPSTWLQFGGVFDQGGILEPGSFGVNLSKQPEAVFTQRQLAEMGKATATNSSGGDTNQFYAQDVEGMFREYLKSRRREARTYSGRP